MSKYCVQVSWSDVPHLTPEDIAELEAEIPAHMRDARTKGIPIMGAGQVYPVPESVWTCEPFEIPDHWPRAYGLDVGWNRTAACWGAWDRETDTVYIYSEHYMGQAPPAVHASAVLARGIWIPGAIDPASAGANQKDGSRLIDEYRGLGLTLFEADNAVEAGIFACYQRISRGGLKVFTTCRNLISEARIYRRDAKGKIVKENDHLMDAKRYLIMTGMRIARTAPADFDEDDQSADHSRSGVTGY